MSRPAGTCQSLLVNLLLQGHERVNQRFGARRTSGDVHVDRNIAVNTLQYVITLLERTARDRARAHSDDVFRLGHLVVETHNLWSHLLCHRAGDNDQVRLTRRRPEDLRTEPRNVISSHRRRNHFNGATSQAKGHWPHRVLPAPVVELFQGGCDDTLFAQFDLQLLVHWETIPLSVIDVWSARRCISFRPAIRPRSTRLSAMPTPAPQPTEAKRPSWR